MIQKIILPDHGGQICPACKTNEILISRLTKDYIKPGEKFHCPVCEEVLTYNITKQATGDHLLLKVDIPSFRNSQEIAISSIRKALSRV